MLSSRGNGKILSGDWERRREDAAQDLLRHSPDELDFLDITGSGAPVTPIPLGHGEQTDSILRGGDVQSSPSADIYSSLQSGKKYDIRINPAIGD